jgi:peptide subunit release factor 1 (eRF1)
LDVLKEVKARDVVDDIIERVLEYGGDVAFVNKNVLKKYQHIALIKFH